MIYRKKDGKSNPTDEVSKETESQDSEKEDTKKETCKISLRG